MDKRCSFVSTLPGRVKEGGEFLGFLGSMPVVSKPKPVVLVGGTAGMARLLALSFEAEVPPALGNEGEMAFRVLEKARPESAERVPGLLMSCWEGTNCSGPVLDRRLVATPDLGPGLHGFLRKYFNGPGEERLTLTVDTGGGVRHSSVEALLSHSLLTQPGEKIPRR